MMKQLIISGAILLTTANMANATCLTTEENQHYQTIATNAENLKGQIGNNKEYFEKSLDLFKDVLKKAGTKRPGTLCDTYKDELAHGLKEMQEVAKASKLTLE